MLIDKGEVWRGKTVLVTGHTGFKGSWLSLLLTHLGAKVIGYSLPPLAKPNLFEAARVEDLIERSCIADVRDPRALLAVVAESKPDCIFHLAAQPLVRYSYENPVETYAVNVMGTVHLLDAVRQVGGVKAVVAVTSDKCYENREWIYPYRETDAMGGHDPYSSSKGCAELVVSAYRNSYFPPDMISDHGTALASVRAGNVIGGGDWSLDRLIPDLVRAFEKGEAPVIRSPGSIRPWQHVLEALAGYLALGERLMRGESTFADGWNFGPSEDGAQPVAKIVAQMAKSWGVASNWQDWDGPIPHEAELLRLDCSKARAELGWRPTLGLDEAIDLIVRWHKDVNSGADARKVTLNQINFFLSRFDGKLKQAA